MPQTQIQINAHQKVKRLENNNIHTKKYEKTKKGFLVRLYRNMKSRITGIQMKKAHLYKGKSLLSKEDFYNWALENNDFHNLFKIWEDQNYHRKLAPSVDRINPNIGYEIGNIRFLTHSENSRLSLANTKTHTFQLLSDLHLEFHPSFESDILPSLKTKSTYLILAGDICEGRNMYKFKWFFDWCSANYKQVFYVLGNHCYYNTPNAMEIIRKFVNTNYKNIKVLRNFGHHYITNKLWITGDTTWTNYDNGNPLVMLDCDRMMNDKRATGLTAQECYDRHLEAITFLKQNLANNKDKKVILVTHHPITRQGTPEQFKNSNINGGFTSDYDQLIIDNPQIKLITSGHSHTRWQGKIGTTDYYINPLGYPGESKDQEYIPLTFEI